VCLPVYIGTCLSELQYPIEVTVLVHIYVVSQRCNYFREVWLSKSPILYAVLLDVCKTFAREMVS
jgi:hypothetical protein